MFINSMLRPAFPLKTIKKLSDNSFGFNCFTQVFPRKHTAQFKLHSYNFAEHFPRITLLIIILRNLHALNNLFADALMKFQFNIE